MWPRVLLRTKGIFPGQSLYQRGKAKKRKEDERDRKIKGVFLGLSEDSSGKRKTPPRTNVQDICSSHEEKERAHFSRTDGSTEDKASLCHGPEKETEKSQGGAQDISGKTWFAAHKEQKKGKKRRGGSKPAPWITRERNRGPSRHEEDKSLKDPAKNRKHPIGERREGSRHNTWNSAREGHWCNRLEASNSINFGGLTTG